MGRLVAGIPSVYSCLNILMFSHLFASVNPKYPQFVKDLQTTYFALMLSLFMLTRREHILALLSIFV